MSPAQQKSSSQNSEDEFPSWVKNIFTENQAKKFTATSRKYFRKVIPLSPSKCLKICKQGRRQSASAVWRKERTIRITASNAHKISRARTSATRVKYFFQKIPPNPNCQYGLDTEPAARDRYCEVTGEEQVCQVGSVIRPDQPWLSASPDGLVMRDGKLIVLEIKCPSSCKNGPIRVPYLIADGKRLNKNHGYYEQVQLQMYVTGATKCHFFVYSKFDEKLITVPLDTLFLATEVPRLESIYFEDILPAISAAAAAASSGAGNVARDRHADTVSIL